MTSSLIKQFSVEKEYEKNSDISPADIAKLREWLNTQPHLPGEHITDLDLILTYHSCDRSQEVAKQVLDLHYTLKTLFTPLFKERVLDKKIQECLDVELMVALPTPTNEGHRCMYLRIMDSNPRKFHFAELAKLLLMVIDLWQYEEGTWPGFEMLLDMEGVQLAHLSRLETMPLRQILYFLQEAMLVKLKRLHFLNAPSFMDKLMLLLRPFLKKETLAIISIHQIGADTIYKYLPKAAFPKEEGGEYKDHKSIRDELVQRLEANMHVFQEDSKKRVDESLRPGKKTTVEDLFGIQGSFKKLDID